MSRFTVYQGGRGSGFRATLSQWWGQFLDMYERAPDFLVKVAALILGSLACGFALVVGWNLFVPTLWSGYPTIDGGNIIRVALMLIAWTLGRNLRAYSGFVRPYHLWFRKRPADPLDHSHDH